MFIPYDFLLVAAISVTITMVFLFALGVWMGRLAKASMLAGGLRMVLAGVVTTIILVALAAVFN